MNVVAKKMADVIENDHLIYVFGAGHAGIISEEMCYRAGGLVSVVPIFAPGLTVNTRPATLETDLERMTGYATLILTCEQDHQRRSVDHPFKFRTKYRCH